jgi:hypothetical protein
MQTLVFNTTTKTVKLIDSKTGMGTVLLEYSSIPTVKVSEGYYEVIQSDEFEKKYPVLRVPIANTNMIINK